MLRPADRVGVAATVGGRPHESSGSQLPPRRERRFGTARSPRTRTGRAQHHRAADRPFPASVTGHTAELGEQNFIRELPETARSKGVGRPHVPVDLNISGHVVAAVHIAVPPCCAPPRAVALRARRARREGELAMPGSASRSPATRVGSDLPGRRGFCLRKLINPAPPRPAFVSDLLHPRAKAWPFDCSQTIVDRVFGRAGGSPVAEGGPTCRALSRIAEGASRQPLVRIVRRGGR